MGSRRSRYTHYYYTYNGDPVRVRLLQGAQEESIALTSIVSVGIAESPDLDSELDQQQHIAIAESFTLEFNIEGDGDFDMLYHYGALDDIWVGNWGIFRTYAQESTTFNPFTRPKSSTKETKPLPEKTGKKPPMANNAI